MPQLREEDAAPGVDRVYNLFPSFYLLIRVHGRRPKPATGRGRDRGCFADDEPAVRSSLRIVLEHHAAGNIPGLFRSVPGERGHDYPMLQHIGSDFERCEELTFPGC